MGKIQYIKKRFARRNLELISSVNKIIDLYKENELKPSNSKIFRKLVSDGVLEDNRRAYKRLGSTIINARLAGLIGWDDIDGRKQPHQGDIEL